MEVRLAGSGHEERRVVHKDVRRVARGRAGLIPASRVGNESELGHIVLVTTKLGSECNTLGTNENWVISFWSPLSRDRNVTPPRIGFSSSLLFHTSAQSVVRSF